MGLLRKSLRKDMRKEAVDIEIKHEGNSILIGNLGKITFGSEYVGSSTGSPLQDFYVYEWFIRDTGEIFYVGKGRGDRYKEYHTNAHEAEKIKSLYDTDCRFVAQNLSEEEALELETKEMVRILDETNDRLTNIITPHFTKRDNGYSRAPNTPPLQFEKAPVFYASEIEDHYYGTKWRPFDEVELDALKRPCILDRRIRPDLIEIVYGGDYEKYYDGVLAMLKKHGSKILKTRYAKSVSAWIYPFDDYVLNYEISEQSAQVRIGRQIPAYHLIDVWKKLVELYGKPSLDADELISINAVNNRAPLSENKNHHNWERGFDAGHPLWEKGDAERKVGNVETAIELFDQARYNGYFAPALYNSYAMAYRKLKDVDNEIIILDEAIERFTKADCSNSQLISHYKEQRKRAVEKLKKRKQKEQE